MYIITIPQLFISVFLGGILSLLTGMSFLSLFEIIFWLLRLPPNKNNQSQHPRKIYERQAMEDEKPDQTSSTSRIKELQKQQSFQSSLKVKESYHHYY